MVKKCLHHLFYAEVFSLSATGKRQKNPKKLMKIVNTDKCSYFPNGLINFNEIFRKNIPYDDIKSPKNPGLTPLPLVF